MADSQLRKGVLELIVLTCLDQHPTYGGALLDRLREDLATPVSSGTVYPLLSRLRKAGHVTSHWEESPSGPPRKVYGLTPRGRTHREELAAEWRQLASTLDSLMEGPHR